MWAALGAISLLVMLGAMIGIVVGLVLGFRRKRWKTLKYSSATCIVGLVVLIFAAGMDGGFDESSLRRRI